MDWGDLLGSGDTDAALVGRKVADSSWAFYASADYVAARGAPASSAELGSRALLLLVETMSSHRLMVWLAQVAPDAEVVSRSGSILGLAGVAALGLGVAALPMPIAEKAGLVLLFGPVTELARTWKLLTNPALRCVGESAGSDAVTLMTTSSRAWMRVRARP